MTEEETLEDKLIHRRDELVSIFEDYFGKENVDAQDINKISLTNANGETYLNEDYRLHVIVRFPEVRIRNENDREHLIRGLYVRQAFNHHMVPCGKIEVARDTYTNAEVKAGYIHSHAYRAEDMDSFQEFAFTCIGTGPLIHAYSEMDTYSPEKVELFCVLLEQWVRVESLLGTPYIKFSQIGKDRSNMWDFTYPMYSMSTQPDTELLACCIMNVKVRVHRIGQLNLIQTPFIDFCRQIGEILYENGFLQHIRRGTLNGTRFMFPGDTNRRIGNLVRGRLLNFTFRGKKIPIEVLDSMSSGDDGDTWMPDPGEACGIYHLINIALNNDKDN